MIRPFKLALVFLTRIPVPVGFEPRPHDWGWSAFCFPFVGVLIGLIMIGLHSLFSAAEPNVVAILLLAVWTLLTGGLHLDGLADTADAWVGGIGDREKTLSIMKDPRCGPIAVTVVVLVLLAKFTILSVIVADNAWPILLWAPILGRGAMLSIMLTTPYARTTGMAATYADQLPRRPCLILLLLLAATLSLNLGGHGLVLALLLSGLLSWSRTTLINRLGGYTGDTLGATCELTEALTLMVLVLL